MTEFRLSGKELLLKTAKKHGQGAMVYVPKTWRGETVAVIRGTENDIKSDDRIVYTSMITDFGFHAGHRNIIKESRKLGKVIVGLLTDEAASSYKWIPACSYDQRKAVIESIDDVWKVVPQYTLDFTENLRMIRPDFVTNGDDWRTGVQSKTREKVIEVLKEWGGQLIEFAYTEGISSTKLMASILKKMNVSHIILQNKKIEIDDFFENKNRYFKERI